MHSNNSRVFPNQASLQPSQATNVLNDRIRLINKIHADIADWLQVYSIAHSATIFPRLSGADFSLPRDRNVVESKRPMPKGCGSLRHGPNWITEPR